MEFISISDRFELCMRRHGFIKLDGCNIVSHRPELLFNIAGMSEIYPLFSNQNTKSPNLFSLQRCIRVNDIDEIGDSSHLTSFCMLGFFGFNLLTLEQAADILAEFVLEFFPKNSLYITANRNDLRGQKIWEKHGIDVVLNDENMWFSGETGVCGIGTEIFFKDLDMELANLVSINGDMDSDGKISERSTTFVDMGAGLERLEMISKGLNSVFDIDEFRTIAEFLGIGNKSAADRIALDHFRTITYMSKQVRISNNKQGYILKKLVRRFLINYDVARLPNCEVRELLLSEHSKLNDVIKAADEYVVKRSKLTADDVSYLQSTIGCPMDLILERFKSKI